MPQATMVECPKCGVKVRKEKLRRHITNVHGEGAKAPAPEESEPAKPLPTVRFPWRAFAAAGIVAVVVIAGYWFFTQGLGGGNPPEKTSVAVMNTNFGTIRITLDLGHAPVTAKHFIDLVTNHKYDGSSFSRVAWNQSTDPQHIWVIQGGAVTGATNVAWEFTGFTNSRYSIAMARSGDPNSASSKDTASSQFFINMKDDPALDPYNRATGLGYQYAFVVFGHVEDAQSRHVVDLIGALYPLGRTGYDGPPTSTVTIVSVTMAT